MRPIWNGSISFGLVNIPIVLRPVVKREELSFRLLRKSDLSPVNYKRVAEADGKEVPWDQIVKGYEYEKGRFVVLKEEDFKRVDIEATQTVDILDFVEASEINPLFFNKPYYMESTKASSKAYELLRSALQDSGKIGIAKVVIKSRQHLAGIKPQGGKLILELMHFVDELADAQPLAAPGKLDASKAELNMAEALIDKMTVKWDPTRYKDDYRSALIKVIEEKVKAGGEFKTPSNKKSRKATNVIDLADVLRRSLAETKSKTKTAGKKSAPAKSRKAA
jgi:DNA end-binding protein Ku